MSHRSIASLSRHQIHNQRSIAMAYRIVVHKMTREEQQLRNCALQRLELGPCKVVKSYRGVLRVTVRAHNYYNQRNARARVVIP